MRQQMNTYTAMNRKYISVLLVVSLFFSLEFYGQGQSNLSRDHNEQVTVVGSFDPVINPSFKINLKPETKSISYEVPDFTYPFLERKITTSIELQPITPVSIRTSRKSESVNNFLKLGFGSQLTPYVEYFHSHGKKKDYRMNAHLYHLSSYNNITDYSPSPFSSSKAGLDYTKYFGNHAFDIGLSYQLNTNRYYGFKPDDYTSIPSDDMLKQMFNLIWVNMGIQSNYTKGKKLNHSIDVDAYYLFDGHRTSEANTQVNFDVFKAFKSSGDMSFQHLGLSGGASFYTNSDSLGSSSDLFVSGTPYYKAKYGMFSFNLGIYFNYLSTGSNSKFHVYPDVKIGLALVPEALTIYAGVKGGLKKNSFLRMSEINPWISSTIISQQLNKEMWKNEKLYLFVGAGGSISQQVNYNLEAAFISFENDYFFINQGDLPTGPLNKFKAVYDDGSVFTAKGEFSYTLDQRLKIWVGGQYDTYTLDSLDEAYHRPLSQLKFGASSTIKKKVNVWAELYVYGQRFALEKITMQPAKQITMDGFLDLNVGVNYDINDKFSVWVKASNLLNSPYERFYNYPVQGLEVMAGISYKF